MLSPQPDSSTDHGIGSFEVRTLPPPLGLGAMGRWASDPRHYQIVVLSLLLLLGIAFLGFPVRTVEIAVLLVSALTTQLLFARATGGRFDPRSPLISGLSLSLLLRADQLWVLALGAAIAISSKFLIRWRGKHVFNPANFGLLIAVLVTGRAWVSPGQWGSAAILGLLFACLGSLVVHRASRSDITWAVLGAYSTLLFGRAAWLGDPWTIPLHGLQNGALLLFAFFMISDPKTTPDRRAGRIFYAIVVASVAGYLQFALYRPSGFLWALLLCSPLVPVIDRLAPAARYRWTEHRSAQRRSRPGPRPVSRVPSDCLSFTQEVPVMSPVAMWSSPLDRAIPVADPIPRDSPIRVAPAAGSQGSNGVRGARERARPSFRALGALVLITASTFFLFAPSRAAAFCGFYVAKADTKLFNRASQVVLARDGDRTVITMANDFKGDPREFAVVVPVPTFLERGQIHVAERGLIDHLDAYTSPRLVEYFDNNPCWVRKRMEMMRAPASASADGATQAGSARELGVTIEARYTVGEYDILILSAEESSGLEKWLVQNGYRIPEGASRVLGSYLKQGMRFFVAKVNLDEQAKLGFANLRPLQVAFESPKFMLPIRLGTVNADGPQELFVYTLTRRGRVETTNYRTTRLPTDLDLPVFVKDEFGDFYRDMFARQVEKDRMSAVYLEYAWDMGWCDPCAANPLSVDQLQELGVFWLDDGTPARAPVRGGPARDVFVTRLHLRYDGDHFPEDLQFQQTSDRSNFQGRYVLRHAWTGDERCAEAESYRRSLTTRNENEARTLANLTGWSIAEIRGRMGLGNSDVALPRDKWWQKLWPGF